MKSKTNRNSEASVNIAIRRATLKDIDILVAQRHNMFEEIKHRNPRLLGLADRTYRKWVIEMTQRKRFVGFLAVNEKRDVAGGGCVWIRDIQPSPNFDSKLTSPYLLSMYTHPDYRRMGIAASIVREAMDWCREKGFGTMTLHASVFGRSLYSKLGWERTWEMKVDLKPPRKS